jgi:hypothetical protein
VLLLDIPLWQRTGLAHAVLEQCPPTDNVRDGEFEIRKGEVHEVVYGRFGRPTAACRLDARECPIEHRQCPRSHAQDQLIEVLEDVVDRSNGTPLITLVSRTDRHDCRRDR